MLEVSSCLYDEDDSTLSADSTYNEESTLTFQNILKKSAYTVIVPPTNLLASQNTEKNAVAWQEKALEKVEAQHKDQAASLVKELSRKGTKKWPPFAVAFKTPFSNTDAFCEYLRSSEISRIVATDAPGTKDKYVNHTRNITKEEKFLLTCENTSSTEETETIKDSSREVREENWNENTTFINAQSAPHEAEWHWNLPKEDKLSEIIGDFLDSKSQSKAETPATFPRCLSELEHEEGEFERIQCMKSVASYRENCQAVDVQIDSDTVRKISFHQPKTAETLDSNSLSNAAPLFNQVSFSEDTVVNEKKVEDFLVFKENFGYIPQNYRTSVTPMSEEHIRKKNVAAPLTLMNIGVQIANTKQQDQATRVLNKVPDKLKTKNEAKNRQKNKAGQVTKNRQQNQLNLKRQRNDDQQQIINRGSESIIKQNRVSNTSKQIPNLETPKKETNKQQQRSSAVEFKSSETMKQLTNILQQKLLMKLPINTQYFSPEKGSESYAYTQDSSPISLCGTIKVRKVLLPSNLQSGSKC